MSAHHEPIIDDPRAFRSVPEFDGCRLYMRPAEDPDAEYAAQVEEMLAADDEITYYRAREARD